MKTCHFCTNRIPNNVDTCSEALQACDGVEKPRNMKHEKDLLQLIRVNQNDLDYCIGLLITYKNNAVTKENRHFKEILEQISMMADGDSELKEYIDCEVGRL